MASSAAVLRIGARRAQMIAFSIAALASTAFAQGRCPEGAAVTATIGVAWFACEGPCAIGVEGPTGVHHRFSVEPRLIGIERDGPSAGILRDGDVLVAVDGHLVTTLSAGLLLANLEPSRSLTLRVRRDGNEMDVVVTPVRGCNAPRLVVRDRRSAAESDVPGREAVRNEKAVTPPVMFGLSIDCGNCGWGRASDGARVFRAARLPIVTRVDPGGPAARAGIQVGDVLLTIDGASLLEREGSVALGRAIPGTPIALGVRRASDVLTLRIVPAAAPHTDQPEL